MVETPWGDMDLFLFSGDYLQRRAHLDRAEAQLPPPDQVEFCPWQFEDSQVDIGEVKAATGIVQSQSG